MAKVWVAWDNDDDGFVRYAFTNKQDMMNFLEQIMSEVGLTGSIDSNFEVRQLIVK